MDVQAQATILEESLDSVALDFRYTLLDGSGNPVHTQGQVTRTAVADWRVGGGSNGNPVWVGLYNDVDFPWGGATSDLTVVKAKVEVDAGAGYKTMCILDVDDPDGSEDATWPVNTKFRLPGYDGSSYPTNFEWDSTPDTDPETNIGLLNLIVSGLGTDGGPFDTGSGAEMRIQALDSSDALIDEKVWTYGGGAGKNALQMENGKIGIAIGTGELGPSSTTIEKLTLALRDADGGVWQTFAEDDTISQSLSSDKFKVNEFRFEV